MISLENGKQIVNKFRCFLVKTGIWYEIWMKTLKVVALSFDFCNSKVFSKPNLE